MRKFIFLIILTVFHLNAIAQTNTDASPDTLAILEEMPSFPGGESYLIRYLSENITYPEEARVYGISGTVYLSFHVGKDGNVSEVKVIRGIGGGCDEEAVRVVQSMPAWRPGKLKGQPVIVQYNLPVKFSLRESE